MKLVKHRKYQAPRVREASLEAEGLFCESFVGLMRVDESENMNTYLEDDGSTTEPLDFQF